MTNCQDCGIVIELNARESTKCWGRGFGPKPTDLYCCHCAFEECLAKEKSYMKSGPRPADPARAWAFLRKNGCTQCTFRANIEDNNFWSSASSGGSGSALAQAQAALGQAQVDLGKAQADLTQAQADLATETTSLVQMTMQRDALQQALIAASAGSTGVASVAKVVYDQVVTERDAAKAALAAANTAKTAAEAAKTAAEDAKTDTETKLAAAEAAKTAAEAAKTAAETERDDTNAAKKAVEDAKTAAEAAETAAKAAKTTAENERDAAITAREKALEELEQVKEELVTAQAERSGTAVEPTEELKELILLIDTLGRNVSNVNITKRKNNTVLPETVNKDITAIQNKAREIQDDRAKLRRDLDEANEKLSAASTAPAPGAGDTAMVSREDAEKEKNEALERAKEKAEKAKEEALKQANEEAEKAKEEALKQAKEEAGKAKEEAVKQAKEEAGKAKEEAVKQAKEEAEKAKEVIETLKQAKEEAEKAKEEAEKAKEEALSQPNGEALKQAVENEKQRQALIRQANKTACGCKNLKTVLEDVIIPLMQDEEAKKSASNALSIGITALNELEAALDKLEDNPESDELSTINAQLSALYNDLNLLKTSHERDDGDISKMIFKTDAEKATKDAVEKAKEETEKISSEDLKKAVEEAKMAKEVAAIQKTMLSLIGEASDTKCECEILVMDLTYKVIPSMENEQTMVDNKVLLTKYEGSLITEDEALKTLIQKIESDTGFDLDDISELQKMIQRLKIILSNLQLMAQVQT